MVPLCRLARVVLCVCVCARVHPFVRVTSEAVDGFSDVMSCWRVLVATVLVNSQASLNSQTDREIS